MHEENRAFSPALFMGRHANEATNHIYIKASSTDPKCQCYKVELTWILKVYIRSLPNLCLSRTTALVRVPKDKRLVGNLLKVRENFGFTLYPNCVQPSDQSIHSWWSPMFLEMLKNPGCIYLILNTQFSKPTNLWKRSLTLCVFNNVYSGHW